MSASAQLRAAQVARYALRRSCWAGLAYAGPELRRYSWETACDNRETRAAAARQPAAGGCGQAPL